MKKFLFLLITAPLFFIGCEDPCDGFSCDNGFPQEDINGLCECDCTEGFTGIKCETAIVDDPCEDITCANGGTCADGKCDCLDGFEGDNCETQNNCFGVDCFNGGTCEDGECDCPDGFSGDDCGVDILASFIGEWGATDVCQIYMYVDTLGNTAPSFGYITTVFEAEDGYQILNFGGVSETLGFATDINGTTISVYTSLLSADSNDTIEGVGELSEDGNTITWTYMTNFDGVMDVCTSDWVKRP